MRLRSLVLVTIFLVAGTIGAAYWLLAQPLPASPRSNPPAVDPARLKQHVRVLSETLYPRSFDQPKKLDAAASYIADEFRKSGATVEDQYFSVGGDRYRNVIARFGPDAGPLVVIGAHYDSYGSSAEGANFPKGYDPQTHTPGADDNASGVAALIELAGLLTRMLPKTAVELVAFALEEPPNFRSDTMGSVAHARRLRAAGRTVAVMISLEMIGYFTDQPKSQDYPLPGLRLIYPDRGDFIAIAGRFRDWSATRKVKAAMRGASDLPVHSLNAFAWVPGVDFSDHASYWNEGFTALMITDTAFYRNPHYHSATDTAATLDYARMAKVVQGVFAAIQQ